MQTLSVTHKLIVYLKFTILNTQITSFLNLATFSVHCVVKSHVYHLSKRIPYKYHSYAQCRL